MTKKHFVALADILYNSRPKGYGNECTNAVQARFDWIVLQMTAYFAVTFPNFDAKKWKDHIYRKEKQ